MMIVLVLLGIFSLIAGRLLISAMRITRSAQDSQTLATRFDGMIRILRTDTWNAARLQMSKGQLLITRANEHPVTWSIAPDQTLIRSERTQGQPQEQRWPGLGAGLTFETRDAAVVLRLQDGPIKRSEKMVLVSQMMLTGRTPR
jgi:hypothetical protein